jgi:MFS family permease
MATIARSNGVTRALVMLLGAAVFLNYVDRGAIGVAAPLMKEELGLSATAFGLAVSAFFWVYAPVQLFVGWLCDRFSVYRLLAWGVVIWAASTLLMGFVGGFASLLVLRVMLGLGESFAFPASSKIIAEQVAPERRGIANATVSIGLALGPAAGTLAGGVILAFLGWRAIFIVFGLLTLLWLIPWRQVTRDLHSKHGLTKSEYVPVSAIIGRWPLWSMSIAHFTSNYGFYFLLAWLPLYLVQSRGLSIGEMTMLATLSYLAQAVSALAFGAWSDRWTRSGRSEGSLRRWMMSTTQLLAGLSILGIAYADTKVELAILLIVAGIAIGSLSVNIFAVAQMFAGPRAAGTWVGIQNALGNLSGVFGPVITGVIVDEAGYHGAFVLTAAVSVFGAIWWAVGIPRIRQTVVD